MGSRTPLMSFNDAKRLVRMYDMYLAKESGVPIKIIARERGIPQPEVIKCINKIEYYVNNGVLQDKLSDARVAFAWTIDEIMERTPPEKLPVRCSSGCRFSPL